MSDDIPSTNWLSIWEYQPEPRWVTNQHNQLIGITNSGLALTGATRDALQGKNIFSIVAQVPFGWSAHEIEQLRDTSEKVRHTGQQAILTSPNIGNNTARQQLVDLLLMPVTDEHGSVTHIIHQAIKTNVDKPEQNQESFSAREMNIYRSLATNLPQGAAFVVDLDLRYLLAEGKALKNANIVPEDLEGKTIWEVNGVKTGNLYEPFFRKALAGESFRHEHELLGYYYVSHGVPLYNRHHEVYAVLVVSYDITERKQAEEALRQSKAHLQLIMESARDYAIFTLDKDKKITDWNTGAEQMMGYSKEEIIGQPGDIVFVPEDRNSQPEEEMRIARKQGRCANERWHLRKDGSRFWGSGFTMPLRDGKKNGVLGFLKIMRDNTQRQKMESSLKQAKEEAEQAARAKEEFLAHMSHEIRTPLNAVVGLAHLLMQQDPRPQQLKNLRTLSFSAQNLMTLVNDILDFSKIKAGKATVESAEVNLRELLNSIQSAHQPRCQDQGNELVFHMDKKVPKLIYTDQLKLSQVMHNLVGNAVKFTHQGLISVEVSLSRQQDDRYWIDFSVSDTGIGISADKLPGIFDTFTQANNATVQQFGGTGLGLSITKLLLQLMDSEIQVESQPGKGSRFFFTLGLMAVRSNDTSAEEHMSAQEADKSLRQGIHLLLVEDSEINRMVLLQFLENWWQLVPDEAADGQQALDMAQQKQYDIILMDVRMPVMNGYEAAKAIRALPGNTYQHVPIIALTADTEQELKKHPEASFFTDVITKPFDPQDLQQKIMRYTSKKKKAGTKKLPDATVDMDFGQVEKIFKENIQEIRKFYEITIAEFATFHTQFAAALAQKDKQALYSLVHKLSMVLNLLNLHELKTLLNQSITLVEENASQHKIKKIGHAIDATMQQVMLTLKEQQHQLVPSKSEEE